jgi:ABC-type molybdate transport system substrate-binding protein
MKERFLLNRITLHAAHVAPRHIEFAALIKTDLADPYVTFSNWAAVPAGIAANAVPLDGLVQVAFANVLIENFPEG